MIWPSIPAIRSRRLKHIFQAAGRWACGLILFFGASAFGASVRAEPLAGLETDTGGEIRVPGISGVPGVLGQRSKQVYLQTENLSVSEDLWQATQGVRLFWGDYYLLSDQILWSPTTQFFAATGQVELGAPKWQLRAEHLSLNPEQMFLQARQVYVRFQGLQLEAEALRLQPELWQFSQVALSLNEGFWQIKADRAILRPEQSYENLILEGVHLPIFGWKWPLLTLTLPGLTPDRVEIRPPLSLLQPELAWQGERIVWGLSSQLWQTEQQRLLTRLRSDPLQTWHNEWIYEWRPSSDYLLSSRLELNPTGARGRVENLWKTPLGFWLRAEAQWQDGDSFYNAFWLPEARPNLQYSSSMNLWLASNWQEYLGLSYRYVAGARWPQQEIGGSILGRMPLWHFGEDHLLWISGLANTIVGTQRQQTAGLRLLDQWQVAPDLELGVYLEHYLSSLSPDYFLSLQRLNPWLGSYAIWQINQDLGLGMELAVSPLKATLTQADFMLTWKLSPVYLNLLIRGIPVGVRLGLQFSLD